jgi:integrase
VGHLGRIAANPLARIDAVETRGKQVRQYRAFTEEELARLFAVAGKRLLAYQMLLYTGQRKSEVRALVWGDLNLDSGEPYVLFREGTMKDKDKRSVALRRELADQLRAIRPRNVDPTKRVFWFCWPTYDILRSDLKKAGIERKDGLGRVVHFHSFRKTMQSLGVRYGINQRAAQEILGHSDANLTARAYTDVASLQLHREIAKLPWISPLGIVAQHGAQNSGVSGQVVSLTDILRQLQQLAQATGTDGVSHALASPGTSCQTLDNGCPGWDRTSDQVINSHLLYR